MNKKQLIDALAHFPDEIEILVSSDSEGNEFSSLEFADPMYTLRSYTGGRTEEIFSAEDLDDTEETDNLKEVLILWP